MFRLIVALSVLCLVSGSGPSEVYDDRVVNGRGAMINEFPYQCSIQQRGSHFCGGSVLNENWILTAAHCMYDVQNSVGILAVRCGTTTWPQGGVLKQIEAVKVHPQYKPPSLQYDVALMKMSGQLAFSAVIKPVKMLRTPLQSGNPVVVSGWGQLSDRNPKLPIILQASEMTYLSRQDCANLGFGSQIMETMICATGPAKDACRGDSGGPLNIAGTMVQVGVVSWGIRCADAGMPGAYSDLTHNAIVTFIAKHVGKINHA